MTLTNVTNAALAKSHISHQKTETDTKQPQINASDSPSNSALYEENFHDNVTLSQSESSSDSLKVLNKKAAETLLPQTTKSILSQSKVALAAQANISPQTAQEILS